MLLTRREKTYNNATGATHPSSLLCIVILTCCLLTVAGTCRAQTDPEYRMEVGGGIGLLSYQGDFNGNPTKNMQPMFSVLAKYRFDPRQALALNVSYGTLKGSSKYEKSYYPDITPRETEYSFKNKVVDAGLRYEYNFWPFGTGFDYRGAKRITPYIYIGMGITGCRANGKTEIGANLPLGGGVKFKVADRLNMALEWTMHFTTNDRLDGISDPYGIKRSGLFKNTDCYSHLRLSLTYDIWARCRTCHNDRD